MYYLDQQLCGVGNATGSRLLSIICSPKAHGKDVTISCTGANKMVALCEVEVYAEVRVGCK